MLEIKVTVDAPSLSDALSNLARAITGASVQASVPALSLVGSQVAHTQPEALTETPVLEAAAQAPAANPAPVAPPAPKVTIDEIARAGAALVDQGKMTELIGLLKNFGVPAVTQLREEQLPGFAEGLRALGAKI